MSTRTTDVIGGFLPVPISTFIHPCSSAHIPNTSGQLYGTIPVSTHGHLIPASIPVSTWVSMSAGAVPAGALVSVGTPVGTIHGIPLGMEVGMILGTDLITVITPAGDTVIGVMDIGDTDIGMAVIIPTDHQTHWQANGPITAAEYPVFVLTDAPAVPSQAYVRDQAAVHVPARLPV